MANSMGMEFTLMQITLSNFFGLIKDFEGSGATAKGLNGLNVRIKSIES